MVRKSLILVLVMLAQIAGLGAASATGIDSPAEFVYVDLAVRGITLDGMEQRLALLQSGQYTVAADEAVDAATQDRVAEFFASYGTAAGAHAAYGTRNADSIRTWIDENPFWQERYAEMEARFDALSSQLSALR